MKESNEVVLGKRLFASIKGQICLTKEHFGFDSNQEKVFFSERALFDKASDSRTLLLFQNRP